MGNELTIAPTMGRPFAITDKIVKKLDKYVNKHDILYNEDDKPIFSPFPTLAEFASKVRINQTTFTNTIKHLNDDGTIKHIDLFIAIKALKDKQEAILSHNALAGTYKNSFAIFWAKNNLGWTDKVEDVSKPRSNVSIQSLTINLTAEDAAMGYKALLGD